MKFIEVLTLSQKELKNTLSGMFTELGYKKVETEYALAFVSPQENVPCLVAHLDTRNENINNFLEGTVENYTPTAKDIIVSDEVILLSPEANPELKCLGADDRVGVKTIIDIVTGYDKVKPHILFTTDEEIGCVGSSKIVSEKALKELSVATMFIQIDRGMHEGKWNEMVFYDYDYKTIPEVYDELSKYWSLAEGSFTDVAVLGEYYCKPIVNLSASYKYEHTRQEYIYLKAYYDTLSGLTKFLEWAVSQDTSEWKYKTKVYSAVNYVRANKELAQDKHWTTFRQSVSTTEAFGSIKDYMAIFSENSPVEDPMMEFAMLTADLSDVDYEDALYYLDEAYEAGFIAYTVDDLKAVLRGEVNDLLMSDFEGYW